MNGNQSTRLGGAGKLWSGHSLPLANCSKLRSDDIDVVRTHMSSMVCPHKLDIDGDKPPIAFCHNYAKLRSLSFSATDYGNPYGKVTIAIPPLLDFFVVQIVLAGEARISQGEDSYVVRAGELNVIGGEKPFIQVFESGFRNFSMKVPRAKLDELLIEELGLAPGDLRFSHRPMSLDGGANSFAQMSLAICNDIDQNYRGFCHPRTIGTAEDMLQRLLLASVPHNHSKLYDVAARPPAPFHVRRVEDYIHARADQPISLSDLIAVSGVCGRTLHSAFRRFRDTTPMNYLKAHRLERARAALSKGLDGSTSVTAVALDSGFTHMGRFAADYFARYGEPPSVTLRRSR